MEKPEILKDLYEYAHTYVAEGGGLIITSEHYILIEKQINENS